MSPTEDELRRALREEEGSGPDPATVIMRAAAYRSERRTKILSAVAAVAVVAGVGTGIGLVTTSGGSHKKEAGSAAGGTAQFGANSSAARAPQYGSGAAEGGAGDAAPAPASCPPSAPTVAAATDTTRPLLTGPVSTVTVCGYLGTGTLVRDATSHAPLTHTYAGSDATAIADALAKATPSSRALSCGAIPAGGLRSLVLYARYATGAAAAPIVVDVGCGARLTNGTTTRASWQQPAQLGPFVLALARAVGAEQGQGGAPIQPSPITS